MTIGRLENKQFDEESEISYYKQLLRKSPKKYSLLNFLANALYKQAEYEEAIHCWVKLLEKMKIIDEFHIYLKIAQAYEALGELEHSYYYYGQAIKKNNQNPDVLCRYGQITYLLENYEEAMEVFKELTEEDPTNEIIWHNLGLTYYNSGFHEEAIRCLKRSLSLDDNSAETWYTIATIYAENYNIDEALFSIEKAFTIDPNMKKQAASDQSFYSLSDIPFFRLLLYD